MTARVRGRAAGAVGAGCLAAALLAGCGGLPAPSAAPNTQARLRHDVQTLAAAAAAHDLSTARAALATLTGDLAQAQSTAVLTAAQLAQVRSAASAVAIDLTPPPSPLPSTVISRATVVPVAPVRATTTSPKHDKKSGNGNGDGNDGGGD